MINAKEAKMKASNAKDVKKLRKRVEDKINESIEDGFFHAGMSVNEYTKIVVDIVFEELVGLGYKVTYEPAQPAPLGCPADQWFSNDYLKISWGD